MSVVNNHTLDLTFIIKDDVLLITTVVAVVLAFLFLGHYARKETVVGYLTPVAGTSKVFTSGL